MAQEITEQIVGIGDVEHGNMWTISVYIQRGDMYLKKVYSYKNKSDADAAHAYMSGKSSVRVAARFRPDVYILQMNNIKAK